ncbi:hypothetical protein [Tolypothrix sp. VBCCA 56010]|uniref:hypothetical protein n=1 Tax=Tolypothrix sp. VBCCA 56010 TaxID=3137731 RepID=UPI003D7C4B1A
MGNGEWVMGNWGGSASPMPHDGRCLNGGNLRTALPPQCPLPIAQCPITNYQNLYVFQYLVLGN